MSDLVVTVPKNLWRMWIDEGDLPGEPWSGGEEFSFYVHGVPPIEPGDRLYVVAWGRLRGYAPVTRVCQTNDHGGHAICREGDAVALTILEGIAGFRGYRRPWWKREAEIPFPDWRTVGVG